MSGVDFADKLFAVGRISGKSLTRFFVSLDRPSRAAIVVALLGAGWLTITHYLSPLIAGSIYDAVALNATLGSVMVGAITLWVFRAFRSQIDEIASYESELKQSKIELLDRLVRVAQLRDGDTAAHILRMAKMCKFVALSYGFDEDEAENLFLAARLHDIGKIGIPDSILHKPGALTPEERKVMQEHVAIGIRILCGGNSRLLRVAERVALTHHEKWDGSGYPFGLAGEEIPIEGRIAALCDVLDALASKRPYKQAWSMADTVDEIRAQSGKHFDPTVVEAFLNCLPQINSLVESTQSEANREYRKAA
jgi:HD-GYP domain-containing protein (c-di-GMP phosphodiesterase class II)